MASSSGVSRHASHQISVESMKKHRQYCDHVLPVVICFSPDNLQWTESRNGICFAFDSLDQIIQSAAVEVDSLSNEP